MPKEVDPQQKRSQFADATWRVMADEGLPAATMRRIAAETNCTTGALTHYFPSREALLVEALRRAHYASGARLIAAAQGVSGHRARLQTLLLEALPLDSRRMKEWRTRLTVWAAASTSETLRAENSRRYQEWGALLEQYLKPIISQADWLRREVVLLMGLIDGLALRLLLHAPRGPSMQAAASEITAEVRFYLEALEKRHS